MEKIAVVIVAGGSGSRMGGTVPKQFLPLAGRPVLVHTVERFLRALPGAELVVVLPEGEQGRWSEICRECGLTGTHKVAAGGANRFESVRSGLALVPGADYILVQDGVRPLVGAELIGRVMDTVRRFGTALPVVEPVDSFRRLVRMDAESPMREYTVRVRSGKGDDEYRMGNDAGPGSAAKSYAGESGADGCADWETASLHVRKGRGAESESVFNSGAVSASGAVSPSAPFDRALLRAVQTPQGFAGEILRKAYRRPWSPEFTDDASVVERDGVAIALCRGARSNIKITTPEDLVLAEALLRTGI